MKINLARFALFFAFLGLLCFVPAIFLPAFLVANSIEGSKWYSFYEGFLVFWRQNHYFLALLIGIFSGLFPLVKFLLTGICAVRISTPGSGRRHLVVNITQWTAKYSMLDVLVVAMLILILKVDDFVRLLPTIGIYLFAAAIFCSIVASWFLKAALHREDQPPQPRAPGFWKNAVLVLLLAASSAFAFSTARSILNDPGPTIHSVEIHRLTQRLMPRTAEKALALGQIGEGEDGFFSKDTWIKFREAVQTLSTDKGWADPKARVVITTRDGQTISSAESLVSLDQPVLNITVPLTQPIRLTDIDSLAMVTSAEYLRLLSADNEEETLKAAADPYRRYMKNWYGRVFWFHLISGNTGDLNWRWIVLATTGIVMAGIASLLLIRPRKSLSPQTNH